MADSEHLRHEVADNAISPTPAQPRRPWHANQHSVVIIVCWLYAAIVLGLWGGLRWSPPELAPSQLFLYGPRWVVALPVLLLVPLVIKVRSRCSALALALAMVAFNAIWGFNLPWRSLLPVREDSPLTLRLLTCNVQAEDLKTADFAAFIWEARPDLVLLQEYALDDPRRVLGREEWYVRSYGEFCLASRYPILDFEVLRRPDFPQRVIAVRAKVSWLGRTIPVVGVHLMTPRGGLEAIISSPLRGLGDFKEITSIQSYESELLRRWVQEGPGSMVLAGDFNLTIEHPMYQRDWADYANAFSQAGWGLGHTMFTRRIGLRIDNILSGASWRPDSCWVGPAVGSAHHPVVADLVWSGPPPDRHALDPASPGPTALSSSRYTRRRATFPNDRLGVMIDAWATLAASVICFRIRHHDAA